MSRAPSSQKAAQKSPLLFDCCRCGPGARMRCMACQRWSRHFVLVTERRKAWNGGRHA